MSIQTTQPVSLTVEWDDSVVIVFSFQGPAGKTVCGFPHLGVATQVLAGSQTQVSAILQIVQQQALQASADPATWVETVKNAARSTNKVTVVFEDSQSAVYTTQTGLSFTLQQLFSLAG